ncbi:hypothetical protein AVEN_58060-1 [Araneus ventricosus]|uniref:Uncharacterized protein n=1 Tax=Araneus ventricosus TaxID=182803 RepID=A0A4Y2S6L2_ARAVE|nr:hypothetical protein AVEN_58060-1 [Araneus ventricosus]
MKRISLSKGMPQFFMYSFSEGISLSRPKKISQGNLACSATAFPPSNPVTSCSRTPIGQEEKVAMHYPNDGSQNRIKTMIHSSIKSLDHATSDSGCNAVISGFNSPTHQLSKEAG